MSEVSDVDVSSNVEIRWKLYEEGGINVYGASFKGFPHNDSLRLGILIDKTVEKIGQHLMD
jgi:hypothetical protein